MVSTEPVRGTINVEVNPTRERFEIDRVEWEAMSPTQRQRMLESFASEAVNNAGGYGVVLDSEDDEASLAGAHASPLDELHAELVELHRDGGSSNDWAQLVDDFMTARGLASILYR